MCRPTAAVASRLIDGIPGPHPGRHRPRPGVRRRPDGPRPGTPRRARRRPRTLSTHHRAGDRRLTGSTTPTPRPRRPAARASHRTRPSTGRRPAPAPPDERDGARRHLPCRAPHGGVRPRVPGVPPAGPGPGPAAGAAPPARRARAADRRGGPARPRRRAGPQAGGRAGGEPTTRTWCTCRPSRPTSRGCTSRSSSTAGSSLARDLGAAGGTPAARARPRPRAAPRARGLRAGGRPQARPGRRLPRHLPRGAGPDERPRWPRERTHHLGLHVRRAPRQRRLRRRLLLRAAVAPAEGRGQGRPRRRAAQRARAVALHLRGQRDGAARRPPQHRAGADGGRDREATARSW